MTYRSFWRSLPWLAALVLSWFTSVAFAQNAAPKAEADPPGRVAHLSFREGEVVFAPSGEDEWIELPQNRPLTNGDRLWADKGSRAELQLGGATLHVGGETHVGVSVLDDQGTQLILEQGVMHARVRELQQGENFEIDTPNVAVRMTQAGDMRVDVDEKGGQTRVVVLSGAVTVFGDGNQSVQLAAGQTASFSGRALARVQGAAYRPDEFAQWAGERDRVEEQSVSARFVPRGVVGYSQLDQHGDWDRTAEHGAVWYPRTVPENWAPYRQGRWTHVAPWGWTWVDEAPWGFAPFHYGRWAQINNRWGWVPGRLAPRPVYSPALVVFMGGGPGGLVVRSGPGVGWYPLAPGEAWWPSYRASTRYIGGLNFAINLGAYPRGYNNYYWARRPYAVTAVQLGDFRLGRPVFRAWSPLSAQVIARARIGFVPDRPGRIELRAIHGAAPRLQIRPAHVHVAAGAHFANRPGSGFRAQAAVGRPQAAVGRPAGGRSSGAEGNQPVPRQVQRQQDQIQQRAAGSNDRAGGRPSPRSDNDRSGPRGEARGPEGRQQGRGPEARDERGGGRGPEARQDRPGRGPEARDERGGGRGPEAREQRGGQERAQQQPQREQQRAAPQQQPQREQQRAAPQQREQQRGGGRGKDDDDDKRGGGNRR